MLVGIAGETLSFPERAHELPARGSALALLSDERSSLYAAATILLRRGYAVSLVLLATPAAFAKAAETAANAAAAKKLSAAVAQGLAPARWRPSSRQLWQPSSVLSELLPAAEAAVVPPFKAGGDSLALDLGCVSLRACVRESGRASLHFSRASACVHKSRGVRCRLRAHPRAFVSLIVVAPCCCC